MDEKIAYIIMVFVLASAAIFFIFFREASKFNIDKYRIYSHNILSTMSRSYSLVPTDEDIQVMADTIYGEARGELSKTSGGVASLIAIANVIMNRAEKNSEKYGISISDVCRKPMQFSCWNMNDSNRIILLHESRFDDPIHKICKIVAQKVASNAWPDLTKGATHYYASFISSPKWADKKKLTVKIGAHNFYAL